MFFSGGAVRSFSPQTYVHTYIVHYVVVRTSTRHFSLFFTVLHISIHVTHVRILVIFLVPDVDGYLGIVTRFAVCCVRNKYTLVPIYHCQ